MKPGSLVTGFKDVSLLHGRAGLVLKEIDSGYHVALGKMYRVLWVDENAKPWMANCLSTQIYIIRSTR